MDTRIIPEGNLAEKALPPQGGPEEKGTHPITSVLKNTFLAFLTSGALNVAIFVGAKGAGVVFLMRSPGVPDAEAITILHVLISTLVGTIGAAIVFRILLRFAKNPVSAFQIISFVVLLLSFSGPLLLLPDTDVLGKSALAVMHVIVAVVIVPLLLRTLRPR